MNKQEFENLLQLAEDQDNIELALELFLAEPDQLTTKQQRKVKIAIGVSLLKLQEKNDFKKLVSKISYPLRQSGPAPKVPHLEEVESAIESNFKRLFNY